jgi:hypothetical protein
VPAISVDSRTTSALHEIYSAVYFQTVLQFLACLCGSQSDTSCTNFVGSEVLTTVVRVLSSGRQCRVVR